MVAAKLTQQSANPLSTLDFVLPPNLEASDPPEARGLSRDAVRLMVSRVEEERVTHTHFRDIGDFLAPGDVLVINTSGTLNAALPATGTGRTGRTGRTGGTAFELHLSTHLPGDVWSIEPRRPDGVATQPYRGDLTGQSLALPAGGVAHLIAPYPAQNGVCPCQSRLWLARLALPMPWREYLAEHGAPIRYGYVPRSWPSGYYQTVYATEMGSAEMPSAGRAFTPEILTGLVARGVAIAPLLLHTGVASLEEHEPPYEEWYRVPEATARAVNGAHGAGRRVVAVGTTVVRALETVTDTRGMAHPGEGWTPLVITPARGLRAVDALLTGLHEPRASHLAMLEALAGRDHLRRVYAEAIAERYLWHEFGDTHLLIGQRRSRSGVIHSVK